MIEVRKIRHVVMVARHGGFARAAEALHITQSALTKSVQSIESRLGIALFERGPRGVRVTPAGDWFIERAARVLGEVEEIENGGAAIRTLKQGRLRVAAGPAALDTLLRDPLASFARHFPGVRVEVTATSVEHVCAMLLRSELDVAIGSLDSLKLERDLEVRELYSAPVSLFVRRGHPLDRSTVPSLHDLFRFPLVGPTPPEPHYTLFRQIAVEAGSPYRQPHILVGSFPLLQRVIETTDAFSFVFEEYAGHREFDRRFRSWSHQRSIPPLTIDVATRAGVPPNRAVEEIVNAIKNAKLTRAPRKKN